MTRVRIAIGLAMGPLLGLLVGCAGPRMDIETAGEELRRTIPAAWSTVADSLGAPMTQDLLELIDDPALTDFVTAALAANPDLRAAALRVEAAGRLLVTTRAARWPYAEIGYAEGRDNQGFGALGERKTESTRRLSLGIDWDMDLWRRLAALQDADRADLEAQTAAFAAARDALGARIIRLWIETVSLSRALEVERERIEVLERLQASIRRRYSNGIGDISDLAAARAGSELAEAEASILREERERALRALEILAGRIPRTELQVAGALPVVTRPSPGCPLDALARRPDVTASWLRLEATDHAAAAAAKAMLPSQRLTVGVNKTGTSFRRMLDADILWSVMDALSQPLFDRGALKARYRAAALEIEAAFEDYRAAILHAIGETEDALNRERRLLDRRTHLDRALAESSRSTQVAEDRYRRGLAGILELLQARDLEMNTRRRVIAIDGEILANRVTIALAIGAGFEEDEL